jgi:DNA-binding SARP family transcriptional activator/tetratricopeptide (TPR) repeat protein/DNA-binding XRE family transcriptional regulator
MAEHCGDDAGGLVRRYRQKAGFTQRQLAAAAGVSVGVVRDLEQGLTAHPRAESVRLLAGALGLSQHQARELSLAARGNDDIASMADAPGRASDVRIGVLGPLAAWRHGVPVALGPPMQRAVLGLLALYAGTGLSRAAITDALWGDDPPATAVPMVHSYISRLRRLLGPGPVGKSGNGYRLETAACELDLRTFAVLVRRAGEARAAGELTTACQAYADALALWQGDPLADCDTLRGHPAVVRLSQQKADAVTSYADAAIAARCPDRILPQLRELTDREPLNERAHALLMVALAGSGQQATALAIFDQVRRRLDKELGIRPGAELTSAQAHVLNKQVPASPVSSREPVPATQGTARPQPADRQTLAQVPCTNPERALAAGDQAGRAVPQELPAPVAHFVGRAAELAALTDLLDRRDELTPGALVISAIGGTAGVGKTALAVHWGHQVAGRFPDGQLYVNLRGYDPGPPLPVADALAGVLRSLGVPGQDIPPEAGERAACYRSRLAGKRMLIMLDNAGSADQVRPLLPGTPACTVLVTSRDALAGLVARDGAARLDLDVLSPPEAVALLRTLIGARVDAEPDATARLADQCCRLPLALRVAAELATTRKAVSLAGLTSELADLRTRLDLLAAGGDRRTQVRAVFSWSYRRLDTEDARTFRLLGLHPGPDLEPYATAALTGATVPQARRALDVLARAHLIQPAAPGRYGMHDLLRGYARELAMTHDSEEEKHAALSRLFDHYLHIAAAAMDTLFPAERHHRPRIPRPTIPVPPLGDPVAAREWLDRERAALVAAAGHTAASDWPGHATRLATTLARYLHSGGHFPEAITIYSHALGAARRIGDRTAEATVLIKVGNIDRQQGCLQQSVDRYRQALALFRAAGDRAGEARARGSIGLAETELGRYEQATRHQHEAVAIFRDIGDRSGEALALGGLGLARQRQGRYQEAVGYYQQSRDLSREIGDREDEAWALGGLGVVDLLLDRCQHAAGYLRQALALFQDMGNRVGESEILVLLGSVYLKLGRYEQAARNLEQALAISRETGARALEAVALNGLGDVLSRTGDPGNARAHHATALRLASEAAAPREQARAHSGLARACQADGDSVQARHHWQEALTRYAAIGAPEADRVRAEMARTAHDDRPGS